MQRGEDLPSAWATPDMEPPVPHAELLTIGQIAEKTGESTAALPANLEQEGFGKNETAGKPGQLAKTFGIPPMQIYTRMLAEKPAEPVTGSGFGRMRCSQSSGHPE